MLCFFFFINCSFLNFSFCSHFTTSIKDKQTVLSTFCLTITSAKFPSLSLTGFTFHPTVEYISQMLCCFITRIIFSPESNNVFLIPVWGLTRSTFDVGISSNILFMAIHVFSMVIKLSLQFSLLSELHQIQL